MIKVYLQETVDELNAENKALRKAVLLVEQARAVLAAAGFARTSAWHSLNLAHRAIHSYMHDMANIEVEK